MFQYLLRIVTWLVWYIKYKLNRGDRKHKIKISLLRYNDNPAAANYRISVQGNSVIATFNPIQLNQEHGNGIHSFETESDFVLPFNISTLKLKGLNRDGDTHAKWFIRWIEIGEENYSRFTFNKWINPMSSFIRRNDTLLPQDESSQYCSDIRGKHLAEKRVKYGFELYRDKKGVPVKIKKMPKEEKFSFYYLLTNLVIPKVKMFISQKIITWYNWLPERWLSPDEMKKAYQMYFKTPRGFDRWPTDQHFANQRLNECNWSSIKRVGDLADITDILPDGQLDNVVNINALINEGNLFYTDIKIPNNFQIPSSVAFFEQTVDTGFRPLAIKLNVRRGTEETPVFYPTHDQNVWKLAKMWSNLADASIHLGVVHLGLTHLLMEGVAICVHRNLSIRHPVYKLLAPHFYYNLAINELARSDLLGPNAYIDKTMIIQTSGVLDLLEQRLENWRLDIDGTLPTDLQQRGIMNPDGETVKIPGFFYAEDGLQLFKAIRDYVEKYVNHYYAGVDDEDTIDRLLNDWEIQAFYTELVKPRARENGGIGIQGVPSTNGRFERTDQLIDTLTSTIFICTVMHAATNFPQYDEYGFTPNYTTILHNAPPVDTEPVNEKFLLDCLPSVNETFDIMTIFTILSQVTTKPLGNFEVQYIDDPDAVTILDEFRAELARIEQRITNRNNAIIAQNQKADSITQYPYTRLLPSNIPSSIAI
ncbi:ALOX5 [Mytilus coruscus]|uniref:ALOX5 n=1 Tax=Mytilus coruscus TaxID=42192 RepID=A0A6J8ETJ3_MYTCO|nr:ALOX5 [Mytilus coruscus]